MNTAKIIRAVLSVSLALMLLAGCGTDVTNPTVTGKPFLNGSKQPWEYTLEEFRAMSDEEQVAFRNSLESLHAFYAWVEQAEAAGIRYPWEKKGAKQPIDYTWAEFEALSAEEQIAFQNSLESFDAFDAWLQNNEPKETMPKLDVPWENGGKQPKDYTWEEFEALDPAQQMLFQESFGSIEDFDAWLHKAQRLTETYPWEESGAKQPKEYTWSEFEALSAEAQMVFQNSFGSFESFDEWMQKAQGIDETYPWDKAGAKQPKDYTWAEFEALTGEEQMAFQSSFGSQEDFDAWLQKNEPQETGNGIDIPWENGGKQPKDYTWAEFEALSAELQTIFQNSFRSFEAFDAWMQRVNP